MGDWAATNDSGSAGYSPEQEARVLAVLERHRGRANAITRQELCLAAHLDKQGRTLRAICRALDLDQDGPLLGYDFQAGSLWVCASMAEAYETDRWFEESAKANWERLRARQRKAARAVAAQPLLFELPV